MSWTLRTFFSVGAIAARFAARAAEDDPLAAFAPAGSPPLVLDLEVEEVVPMASIEGSRTYRNAGTLERTAIRRYARVLRSMTGARVRSCRDGPHSRTHYS